MVGGVAGGVVWGNPEQTWRAGPSGRLQVEVRPALLASPALSSATRGLDPRPTARKQRNGEGMCGPGPPPTFQHENPGCRPRARELCLILPCRVRLLSPRVLGVCLAWSLLAFQLCLPVSFIHVPSPVVLLLTLACSSELNSSSIFFRKFPWSFYLAGSLKAG